MSNRLPTLSQAAEKLGVRPRKFIAELRRRRIIDADNYAMATYANKGFLKVEQRSHPVGSSGQQRIYFVTTVTDEGLFFLQGIANELRGASRIHGSNGQDAATAERELDALLGANRTGAVRGVQS